MAHSKGKHTKGRVSAHVTPTMVTTSAGPKTHDDADRTEVHFEEAIIEVGSEGPDRRGSEALRLKVEKGEPSGSGHGGHDELSCGSVGSCDP